MGTYNYDLKNTYLVTLSTRSTSNHGAAVARSSEPQLQVRRGTIRGQHNLGFFDTPTKRKTLTTQHVPIRRSNMHLCVNCMSLAILTFLVPELDCFGDSQMDAAVSQ